MLQVWQHLQRPHCNGGLAWGLGGPGLRNGQGFIGGVQVSLRNDFQTKKFPRRGSTLHTMRKWKTSGAVGSLVCHPTFLLAVAQVCRLHQEERCRFGRDCKNFHLCRDVYARLQLAHINIKAAPPVLQTAPCKPLKTVDIPQLAASISPQSPAYSSAGSARQPSTPAQRHSTPPPMVLQRWPLSFSFSRDRSLSAGWESEQSDSPGPSSGSPSPTSSPLRDGRLSTQTLQVMQALESFRSEFRGAPVVR